LAPEKKGSQHKVAKKPGLEPRAPPGKSLAAFSSSDAMYLLMLMAKALKETGARTRLNPLHQTRLSPVNLAASNSAVFIALP